MRKIGWVGTLLYLVMFVVSCSRIKEPEFRRIENFRVSDVSLTSATVKVNVVYYNPNNFNMTVKETTADLYLDGVYMGKFAQDTTINVGNGRDFSIPVSGTVSVGKLLELDLRNISSKEVDVQASGSTKVGKAGIFITKPFTYQGKHRLNDINL